MIQILMAENSEPFNPRQIRSLTQWLPQAMQEQALKYRRWQDAQAYLLGRALLAKGLQQWGFEKDIVHEMRYTAYNRPYLPATIDFNISHAGKYILCAISTGCRVGIDIEEVHHIEIADFSSQFTADELFHIEQSNDKYSTFFKYWTIKEAVIKADGRGLSIPLREISIAKHAIVENKLWYIHSLNIAPAYIAHLASDTFLAENLCPQKVTLTTL